MTDAFPSVSTFGLGYSYGGEETKHSYSISHVTAHGRGYGRVWYETDIGSLKHCNSFVHVLIQREFPGNNPVLWMYFLEIGD